MGNVSASVLFFVFFFFGGGIVNMNIFSWYLYVKVHK